jgi:hypothetical protein
MEDHGAWFNSELQAYWRNARTQSMAAFGFTNPILIDRTDTIVAGHGRLRAAQLLGIDRYQRSDWTGYRKTRFGPIFADS